MAEGKADMFVIGAGYAGLITAICMALAGGRVLIYDRSGPRLASIKDGKPPFHEEGLAPALARALSSGKLETASSITDGVGRSDTIFICVGTPPAKDGSIDLSQVEAAAGEIASCLGKGARKLIVIRSTVVPGTTESVAQLIAGRSGLRCPGDFGIAMNPEFLRQGSAIADFMKSGRIIIGCDNAPDAKSLEELYSPLGRPIFLTTTRTAEMSKYVYNAMLAAQISFINEMGLCSKSFGVDIDDVIRALDLKIGMHNATLKAGCGFGGSCLEKDAKAIAKAGRIEMPLLLAVLEVNDRMVRGMADLLETRLKGLEGKKICLLGLSFKSGTDDLRNSRALALSDMLIAKKAVVSAFDPVLCARKEFSHPGIRLFGNLDDAVAGCDAVAIMTDWPQFRDADLRDKIVVDGRGVVPKSRRGRFYEGVCWP